jgi:hypothetical protein
MIAWELLAHKLISPAVTGERIIFGRSLYRIVGITNSAPSLIPDGQRLVTVFVFV